MENWPYLGNGER